MQAFVVIRLNHVGSPTFVVVLLLKGNYVRHKTLTYIHTCIQLYVLCFMCFQHLSVLCFVPLVVLYIFILYILFAIYFFKSFG